jgi:hypothetical protein
MYGPGWTAIPLKRKYPEHPVSRQRAESDYIIFTSYPPPTQAWAWVKIVAVAVVSIEFESSVHGAGIDSQFLEGVIVGFFQASLHLHKIVDMASRPYTQADYHNKTWNYFPESIGITP